MANQPGKILRFFGNLVIILLFSANVVAAWKDLSTPYWFFNFIMLGVAFYLLNSIACCFEEDFDTSDLLGSYPVIGYRTSDSSTRQSPSPITSDASSCVFVSSVDEAVEAMSDRHPILPKIEESPVKK
ncbi:uncharacterized protein LOC135212009 [Macrobrachium nipponense]|uniref:uncharacterized protein LOC135212009 n=1 Tax=Macrobrachium nipponense TaxID=159736 RepID=UPI0030C83A53